MPNITEDRLDGSFLYHSLWELDSRDPAIFIMNNILLLILLFGYSSNEVPCEKGTFSKNENKIFDFTIRPFLKRKAK